MTITALIGGTVVDQLGTRRAEIVVDDDSGVIVDRPPAEADMSLDAEGCFITPGFVDLHTHLRQPGNEAAETIESGSRSAALGGFTAVVAMPNTTPCTDTAAVVAEVLAFSKSALCQIKPSAAITVDRAGRELSPMGELIDLGVRLFTDAGAAVQDAQLMRRALEYVGSLATDDGQQVIVAQHGDVTALSQGGVMHEGVWSARLGLGGQPAEAEELMIARDLALARLTGVPVHIQHLTTARGTELVREAKAAGTPVTAEVSPHHLCLTDASCATYDPNVKVHPPLRTDADVEAVKAGVLDGTIDAIATGHAPHTIDSKELPFDQAPAGVLGLETAFAVVHTDLEATMEKLVEVMSVAPARIGGLEGQQGCPVEPGQPANLAVIDPNTTWTIDWTKMASRSRNTPFDGKSVTGRVRHTIFQGEAVVTDGQAQR